MTSSHSEFSGLFVAIHKTHKIKASLTASEGILMALLILAMASTSQIAICLASSVLKWPRCDTSHSALLWEYDPYKRVLWSVALRAELANHCCTPIWLPPMTDFGIRPGHNIDKAGHEASVEKHSKVGAVETHNIC